MPNERCAGLFSIRKRFYRARREPKRARRRGLRIGLWNVRFPAAKMISGTLHGFEYRTGDDRGVASASARETKSITSVFNLPRLLSIKAPVADGTVDYAMLFNILHTERPLQLLTRRGGFSRPGGRVAVIHWNFDPTTPPGRRWRSAPAPEDASGGRGKAGLSVDGGIVDLPRIITD